MRNNIVWNDQSIINILNHTYYEGYWTYTDNSLKETLRLDCPKILPSTLVKKVRDKFNKNTTKSNYVKYETLFSNKLVCGHCGSKYGQRIGQYKKHYFCRGNTERVRVKGLVDKICKLDNEELGRVRSLQIDLTDDVLWDKIIEVMEKSVLYKEMFKKEVMSEEKSFGSSMYEIKGYERRIKQNDRKIKDINESLELELKEIK